MEEHMQLKQETGFEKETGTVSVTGTIVGT